MNEFTGTMPGVAFVSCVITRKQCRPTGQLRPPLVISQKTHQPIKERCRWLATLKRSANGGGGIVLGVNCESIERILKLNERMNNIEMKREKKTQNQKSAYYIILTFTLK
ncbi:hypothetical protein DICVIV_04110 [Dictyocaulus viviparus]|uniref:Uncharacterized protein n=1 Tax=Dictyocaulus viviparus TaxID=29172 RepID=A0A0D8XZ88_DICVI|nr:hypothetical protein DICVIV_04110 [Dictyocaulus viviparus]